MGTVASCALSYCKKTMRSPIVLRIRAQARSGTSKESTCFCVAGGA